MRHCHLVAACAVFAWGGTAADAIDFNFTFNQAQSVSPPDVNDSFGPINDDDGSALLNIMNVAGDMWGDVIQDNVTINIEVRYQAPANAGNSAQAFTFQSHPDNTNGDPATDGSRILWGRIIFNPNRKWWFDSTPLSHSEFDMQQVLFRDLPGDQQTGWFSGSPPDLLEVGYLGAVNGTAPAAMQFDASQPANTRSRDALSYALHEIGHMLGVNSTTTAQNEYGADGDYDITPGLAGQAVFAIDSASTSDSHITSTPTSPTAPVLMHTNNLCCARRLPSALDVMAQESTANWTQVRLLRTDFLTGSGWNTAGNWEGDRTPSTAVDAFVRHGGTVTLSAFGAAGNLLVDEGSVVSTQTSTLFVQNATTVGGTPGDTSQITINTGGELDSDRLDIAFDGRVRLVGDSSLLQSERITILSGGVLEGRGTVDINDNLFGTLTSNGSIRVTGGELLIQSQAALAVDLQSGAVEAIDGNLRFDTGFADSIGANITVGAGRQVQFDLGATIGAGGLLNLVGTSGSPATSTGSTLFVGLNGVVNGDGLGVVDNALVLLPSSSVTTQFGDPSSEIRLEGSTFFQGGRVQGVGTARQVGDATVDADTDITIDTYDMDGISGNTTITINSGHTLDIDSPNIDATGANDFDGTLVVNGGTLDIQADWTLDGVLNLNENSGAGVVTGGRLTVSSTGVVNVSGAGRIDSELTLAGELFAGSEAEIFGNAVVTAGAMLETDSPGDLIEFHGLTILGGGSYVGGGGIEFDGEVQVAGNTSIGMAETDLDGSNSLGGLSIAPGVTFSVASTTLDPDDGAYDDVMNVRGTFSSIVPFLVDGTVNLIQEKGQAAPQINGVTGFTVRIAGDVTTTGDAQINRSTVVQGGMDIGAGVTQINGATILFENSANVVVQAGGLLELNGATTYEGGSHTGEGVIQFNGQTDVDADTTLAAARVDLDGAAETTTVNVNDARLTLNVDLIDVNSNQFGGTMNVVGDQAQLEVNLANPFNAWVQTSASVLNFTNPNPGAGAVTMLTGSDLSAAGVVNGTGPLTLGVNVDVRNRLNAVTANTQVHFGGDLRSFVHANPAATVVGLGGVTVDNGTTLNLEGESLVAVDTTNSGRLEVGFQASEVSIDVTVPGHATVRGTFAQPSVGEFAVDLGGLTVSTEYDWLEVIGLARISGTVEATLIDGFVPKVGHEFRVLSATDGVIGEFQTVETFDEDDVLGFTLTDVYSGNDVVLVVDDVFLIGDYNDDDVVDAADYAVWRNNEGAAPGTLPNDIHDTPIGQDQYDTWRSHFGNVLPGLGAVAPAPVPEPSPLVLLAALAVGGTCRRLRTDLSARPAQRRA